MDNQPVLIEVREAHRFDESRLAKYLAGRLEGFDGRLSVRQFVGGTSNPTFVVSSGDQSWVLRKRPPGVLLASAHQVEREYRVMRALRDCDVPVPEMLLFCDDETVIGQAFYIMEHVQGRITQSLMPGFTPDERSAIYDDFIRVLAALHSVNHVAVGLEHHGRPGNYFARQIDRWSKQYRASQTDDIPEMERLIEWMPANIPEGDEISVIHGDYRIGNMLIHPTQPRIAAVLDWELSTLGHPLGDLGYHGAYGYHSEFANLADELPALGIPSEAYWQNKYCELTGRDPIENWHFYVAYNLFRLTGISQGVYKRSLDGIASSELALEPQRQSVRMRARRAWALVKSMS